MALCIGIVGIGGIARHCDLPHLKKLAEVKIGALCDLGHGFIGGERLDKIGESR